MVHRPNFHVLNVQKKLKSRDCKLGSTTHDVWGFQTDQKTKLKRTKILNQETFNQASNVLFIFKNTPSNPGSDKLR
jgi:hypothetical protein